MPTPYARPDALVETDWVAAHLNDPTVRIVESDEERTAIEFDDHGVKKFVTSMVVLEITNEKPTPKAAKPRRTRRAKK